MKGLSRGYPGALRRKRAGGFPCRPALNIALALMAATLFIGCMRFDTNAADFEPVEEGQPAAAASLPVAAGGVPVSALAQLPIALETQSIDGLQGPFANPQAAGLDDLQADRIVSAHEQVINGIYHASLNSVVSIRVAYDLSDEFRSDPDARERWPWPEGRDGPDEEPDLDPDWPDSFFRYSGGSGFVWDAQGHVVTNHHVVVNADKVTVILADQTELEAEVSGTDPDSDLAVLKVADPDGLLRAVTLGDSDQVAVGQLAVALGSPFGQQFSVTSGIISGVGRTIRSEHSPFSIPEVIQTDAPINPGNSGGPLLNRKGQAIGVNTLIISRTGASSGVGFAVPINIARQVVPALIEDGEYEYSWLGISGSTLRGERAELMDLPRNTRGALVIDVAPEGPADKAGLRGSQEQQFLDGREVPTGGDIIISVDGQPVKSIDDVIAYLVGRTRPDQKITLGILRDGEEVEITVTLGSRPGSL